MGNIEDELTLNLVHDHSEDEYKMSDEERTIRAHDLIEQYCRTLELYLKNIAVDDSTRLVNAIQQTLINDGQRQVV